MTRKASKRVVGQCKGMERVSSNEMLREPEERRKRVSRVVPVDSSESKVPLYPYKTCQWLAWQS